MIFVRRSRPCRFQRTSLAGVDLVYLGLNVVLTSVETALNNLQIEEKRRQK